MESSKACRDFLRPQKRVVISSFYSSFDLNLPSALLAPETQLFAWQRVLWISKACSLMPKHLRPCKGILGAGGLVTIDGEWDIALHAKEVLKKTGFLHQKQNTLYVSLQFLRHWKSFHAFRRANAPFGENHNPFPPSTSGETQHIIIKQRGVGMAGEGNRSHTYS